MKDRKINQSEGFSMISNELSFHPNITPKAKGIYLFMKAKPNDWRFTIRSMSKQMNAGYDAIQKGVLELKEFGFVEYDKNEDGTGCYHILNKPKTDYPIEPKTDNPKLDNPIMGKSNPITNKEYLQIKSNTNKKSEVLFKNLKKKKLSEIWEKDVPENEVEFFKIAKMFYSLFKRNLIDAESITSTLEKSTYKGFVDPIRLMIQKDKVTLEQFRKVYDFLSDNEFWKKNILSTSKLRLQMPKLLIQASNNGQANKNAAIGSGTKNINSDYLEQIKRDLS